jgi:periplasmic protein TonB
MTTARRDMAQIASDSTALALSVGLFGLLLVTRPDSWRETFVPSSNTGQAGLEVSLLQAADTPPAPQPPARRRAKMHHAMQQDQAPDPRLPEELQSLPVDSAVPEGGAVVSASNAAAADPAPADTRPDLEAQYGTELRADINRRTRPPDSAQYRLHRPSGEVRVGFSVTRYGEPKVVHVLRSSGSSILDEAAVAIVASGHYPPMPARVFAGEMEHGFAVTIEFRAPS